VASNINMSSESVNAEADALGALANNGYLRIYDGVQPADANTAVAGQTLLAELHFGVAAFGAAASGVITAAAISAESSAPADGTAAWYRVLAADGVTPLWDGTVGAAGCDINLNTATISAGAEVSISSLTHTVVK
jgi:hypothetical protein